MHWSLKIGDDKQISTNHTQNRCLLVLWRTIAGSLLVDWRGTWTLVHLAIHFTLAFDQPNQARENLLF
jgi:hypothetical protein